MEFQFNTSPGASIVIVEGDRSGEQELAALATALEDADSPVRVQTETMRTALQSFVSQAAMIVATYSVTARPEQLRALAARTLSQPVQGLTGAGQAEWSAIDAAWGRLTAVPAADATQAALREHDRTGFPATDVGEAAAWIERGDVERLGAIMEAGRARFPSTLRTALWERLERRYAALNFVRIAGTAANFARPATADEPLGGGVDWEAAERHAVEGLARHDKRIEIVEGVEQALRGIVRIVALACDLSLDDAFALLSSGKVPA